MIEKEAVATMIVIGFVISYIGAGVLVTTKSPSVLLPISFLVCIAGLGIAITGAIIR